MNNVIEVTDVKYLNNIVEQSHRPIKQKIRKHWDGIGEQQNPRTTT